MKANSPLLGFNNNVKHKGRVFHVQTEDSGVKHPHVITHLFVDGGRILKSTKTSYAEFLEDEDMKQKVRLLMQEQHKAMFIALRAGKFDHMVEATGEAPPPPSSQAAASAPGAVPSPATPPEEAAPVGPGAPRESAPREGASAPMPIPDAPPSSAGSSPAREVPPSEGSRPAASSPNPLPSTSGPASAPQAPGAAAPPLRAPTPSAGRPATQPPSSGHPVSLRPPSLLPPPPRAPLPSVSNERSPFLSERGVSERGSVTSERATNERVAHERVAPLDRPATAPDRMAAADRRQADPRAETLQALPQEPHRPRLASPLELNLEALERSASDTRPSLLPDADIRDLPPPPAGVLGKKPANINTSYRSIQHADPRAEQSTPEDRPARPSTLSRGLPPSGDAPPASVRSPSLVPPNSRPRTMPMPQPATTPPARAGRSVVPPRSLTPQGARYAASRPASIFGSARPQEGSSIFGEDLISEKSLDEVILSYLAEDLEGGKTKR